MASLSHWKQRLHSGLFSDPVVREVLDPEQIEARCRQSRHEWRDSFWGPGVTLITFLLQVLSAEKTLRAAVASLRTQLAGQGVGPPPSSDPSAYCQARRRLPKSVIRRLSEDLADRMEAGLGTADRWHGHRLRVVDGTTVSMPDTATLQKAFPQPASQKPGCGFPVARLVVLFGWATGAVLRAAVGNLRRSELTLFRDHYAAWLQPGDVILGDRHYCSYVDLVRLQERRVSVIYRLHQRRPADFRHGRRRGPEDRLVVWKRPQQWFESFGVDRDEFERLPETLSVRLIRIAQTPRGFRSRTIVVATTLLDATAYPADEIRALYRDRWTAELNLRSLKTHLGMDILRGQSQDVVRKEIAVHLLAYNLIRLLMGRAAREHGRDLHRLSFTGTLHRLRASLWWTTLGPHADPGQIRRHLLASIAADVLPNRPDRFEPRRRKRRPKEYSLLRQPRSWYHQHGDTHAR